MSDQDGNLQKLYAAQELRTYTAEDCCCDQYPRIPIQTLGTVGKTWHHEAKALVDAVVLADCGTNCGGGDDIKVCVRDGLEINDWFVEWIGANEFHPPQAETYIGKVIHEKD